MAIENNNFDAKQRLDKYYNSINESKISYVFKNIANIFSKDQL